MEVLREIREHARFHTNPRQTVIAILLLIALNCVVVTPIPCPFRAIFGLPCPLCGMTSALGAVLSLDWRSGLELHPLVVIPVLYLLLALIRNRFWISAAGMTEKVVVMSAFLLAWLVKISEV